ncbi:PepSY domain-containing protein [Alcanivorax sp. S6407]|uniref:PepSY-associated TM helix domain-containing protein n=1 Tax=Alcanivorax sp. S6407 TaxID=2926424 RepID=UPI001FF63873|nr:PepSY-associated TM helix domain-containing protein [Alcanivorax sp. S6407]MCK0155186.1 PepSY domain-containing protein [Alcanivorax sp. S6407]
MAARKPTRQWRQWHRWLGLAVALPVLVLSITGVMLNHIESLGWSSKPMSPWLARWYGAPVPKDVKGYSLDGQWYAELDERLYINGTDTLHCPPPLQGVAQQNGLLIVGCGHELMLLDDSGQLVERIGKAYGLPAFEHLGSDDQGLILDTGAERLRFDVDQLMTGPYQGNWQPVDARPLPKQMKQALISQSVPPSLNWQRLLLDLHAGRIAGLAGQLVMDFAALVLTILAITGTVIWSRTRR